MISTPDQEREFHALMQRIEEAYRRPTDDGNGYPDKARAKAKTKDFVDAVTELAKLATAIVKNGESTMQSMGPEDFGKLANSVSVTAAKARADAKLFKKRD
jgi:hypothetical protein